MVDKPSQLPSDKPNILDKLKPKPEQPIVIPPVVEPYPPAPDNSLPNRPGRPPAVANPLSGARPNRLADGRVAVNPLHPETIETAQAAFDESVVALDAAKAGRDERNIPLSDSYWGAVNAHRVAYLALKDSYLEMPISPPPDSDMLHDIKVAIDAMKRGEPNATAMSAVLSGGISVPVDNVPEEFMPFVRATIPLGVKLVTAVEQPVEDAVIVIPIPPPEPPPVV